MSDPAIQDNSSYPYFNHRSVKKLREFICNSSFFIITEYLLIFNVKNINDCLSFQQKNGRMYVLTIPSILCGRRNPAGPIKLYLI